mmetsp:Transcript_46611/g.113554  ORF Transcript_46611/g.113554 Transcript_46611/m.113554 type:complete len:96 (-) Transcript_46611:2591-2878(-)
MVVKYNDQNDTRTSSTKEMIDIADSLTDIKYQNRLSRSQSIHSAIAQLLKYMQVNYISMIPKPKRRSVRIHRKAQKSKRLIVGQILLGNFNYCMS